MGAVVGRIEQGQVRLTQRLAGSEGQAVLVVLLPGSAVAKEGQRMAPPADLLEEDAREFRRRPETLSALNHGELA
ncbi:MAG: hypothetical protein HY744_33700 [Deltaproteobacteria bacterium]|nr:hypothetical protein [Deltaproteobacteria bacterium]